MKGLFLAAGYATRLYPLTRDFPKPLLEIQGRSILDWLLDDLDACAGAVDGHVVVTNHRVARHFEEWRAALGRTDIAIVDDGTMTNETRIGAVRDIALAIRECHIDEDLLVLAGDNLLDFSLRPFLEYARRQGTSCVMRYWEPDTARLRKSGVLDIDGDDLVLSMAEKPAEPATHGCCPPFYYFVKEDVAKVRDGLEAGCGADSPGAYIAWLATVSPVHAMEMPGRRYDIGDMESYARAEQTFRKG